MSLNLNSTDWKKSVWDKWHLNEQIRISLGTLSEKLKKEYNRVYELSASFILQTFKVKINAKEKVNGVRLTKSNHGFNFFMVSEQNHKQS